MACGPAWQHTHAVQIRDYVYRDMAEMIHSQTKESTCEMSCLRQQSGSSLQQGSHLAAMT